MVATIAAGTTAGYYTKQAEYYLGGREPAGRWISRTGDFGVINGEEIDHGLFERLHAGIGDDGHLLLSNTGDVNERVAGYDLALSAPKSVSIVYALAGDRLRSRIEIAQQRAVESTIALLDRHAAFGRRGRDGTRLERVSLTVATFPHGEARPAEHPDGKVFADPQCHVHCVILNLARRDSDGSVGALDGRFLFKWKMAAGAAYHAALAAELQKLNFDLGEVGKNGTFEIAGIPADVQEYFSARRNEIEDSIAREGLTTAEAPALAAAVEVRWRRFVTRRRAAAKLADEVDNVTRCDVIEAPERLAEPEGHEALEEADAVIDRRVRKAALVAKVALILGLQAIEWRRRFPLWLWTLGNTGFDERIDEALQAESLVAVFVRAHGRERRLSGIRQRAADELAFF